MVFPVLHAFAHHIIFAAADFKALYIIHPHSRLSPKKESRRDQEGGGELDPHEEASPQGIKSREVVLG